MRPISWKISRPCSSSSARLPLVRPPPMYYPSASRRLSMRESIAPMKSPKTMKKRAVKTMAPESTKTSIGEGIFLRPAEDEAEIIWEAVRAAGLEENGDGVLGLLLLL